MEPAVGKTPVRRKKKDVYVPSRGQRSTPLLFCESESEGLIMANANYRVLYHLQDSNGNTLKHYGSGLQVLVTAAVGSDFRPDATSIKTVLSNHSKVPPGATVVIESVANLDKEANAGVVLT